MEGVKNTSKLTYKKRITSPSEQMRLPESLSLFLRILYTVPWNGILRKTAKNHLSLDFIMTYDVLTPLKVISKDLLKLKHACDTTRVQDFLQHVFMELGTENALVLGYFTWKLFMFRMSPEDYSNYSDTTVKLAKETADKEQKLLGACVEELDPSHLFEDLKNMHLVEEDERKRVDRIPRKQRMEILIGRIAVLKRNEMLNIILFHCKKHGNQYLCSEINAIYGGDTGNSNFTGKSVEVDEEQKLLSLCADEMDPSQLFEDLKNMGLVEDNERKEVMDHIPRKKQMEFLIGRLVVLKKNQMLNILLAHCMKYGNDYLQRKITAIYGGDTANSHLTGRSSEDRSFPGEKVFIVDFTLSTQATGTIKVDIQDHMWHVDTFDADKEEIVIMGLIPDWEPTEEKAVTTGKLAKETADEEQKLLGACVEELDPSHLFEDLKNMHLVEEDERKVMDRIPRKQRMEFLIGRLDVLKRNEMLNILLAHCMKHGDHYHCLWRKILAIYGGDTGNSHFTGRIGEDKSFPGNLRQHVLNRCLMTLDVETLAMYFMGKERFDDMKVCDIMKIGLPFWKNWSTAAEKQVVRALSTASTRQMICAASREHLGMEFQEVNSGSIIIRFTTDMGKSLQKLREACATGKIKDFLPNIFMGTGVESKLGLGDFKWKFCLYKEPCRSSKLFPQEAEKMHQCVLTRCLQALVRNLDITSVCMYIQKKEVLDDVTMRDISEQPTTSDMIKELINKIQRRDRDTYEKFKECLVQAKQAFLKDMLEEEELKFAKEIKVSVPEIQNEKLNPIKLHWNLFAEELDPRKLFADLEGKGLFGSKDGDEMWKFVSRKDRMEFLLERLNALKEPGLSYEILLDHCKKHDEYVLHKIKEKEVLQARSKHQEQSTSAGKRSDIPSDEELIFSATIILSVRRKASTSSMKKNTGPISDMEFEISCLNVHEPVCYFNDIGEDVEGDDDLQDIFMKLEQVTEPEEERMSIKKKQPHLKRKRNMHIDA